MAIAVQLDFKGGTVEQYDQVIQKMGFQPGGRGAPGCLFHWVAKTPEGIRVTDAWETKEQFDSFAQESIVPITREVGISEPPEMQFLTVHNYLTAG